MAQKLKASVVRLAFEDGTEQDVTIRPIDLIRAERAYGEKVSGHRAEVTLYATWSAMGAPGSPERSFDQWLATLEQFDEGAAPASSNGDGQSELDPTPEAVSAAEPQS